MRYIDLDGVILNTEDVLFDEILNVKNKNKLDEDFIMKLVININWEYLLNHSKSVNDSINILKSMNPNESAILTRVHSDMEAEAKINYFKKLGIKQEIIIAPYTKRKDEVVDAKDNILIDDSLKNLRQWEIAGGYPMFFDKKENGIDSWDEYNVKGFQKVLRIDEKVKCK